MSSHVREVQYFGGTDQTPLGDVEDEPCAWRLFHPHTGEIRFFDASKLRGIDEPLRVYREDGWQITALYAPEGTGPLPSQALRLLNLNARRFASLGFAYLPLHTRNQEPSP